MYTRGQSCEATCSSELQGLKPPSLDLYVGAEAPTSETKFKTQLQKTQIQDRAAIASSVKSYFTSNGFTWIPSISS
jgi:hypothetical protein